MKKGQKWTEEQREKKLQRYREKYLGTEYINHNGEKSTLIEYRSAIDCDFLFEDGTTVTSSISSAKTGSLSNPNFKSLFGVGKLGEPRNNSYITTGKKLIDDKLYQKKHNTWRDMIGRCNRIKELERRPLYKDCIISESFKNRSLFFKWFDDNYYEIEGETMCLDKDILIKGNKLYSENTCIFVPLRINSLFIKSNKIRGDLPIGVRRRKNKSQEKYAVQCSIKNSGQKKHIEILGTYDTPEEAFLVYKNFKENYIKQVANEYKDKIPQKLYDAMMKYEVEITD